jgi:hypothetical protein
MEVKRAQLLGASMHSLIVCRAIYAYDVTPLMNVCMQRRRAGHAAVHNRESAVGRRDLASFDSLGGR